MKPLRYAEVAGVGSYLPERVMTNAELAERVDTSDEWIIERTGIEQRHVAADGETTADLALAAARAALADAETEVEDIDLIVLATTTPDSTFPATATKVQAALGMHHGAAFDVQAVCAGFVYATSVAAGQISLGQARSALVIGAETFTRLLDWNDRGTCVLFGDGAGAMVLKAGEAVANGAANGAAAGSANGSGSGSGNGASHGRNEGPRGVLSTHLRSDGRFYDLLYVDGGPSTTQHTGHVRMEGPEVFKHAVTKLAGVIHEALADTGLSADDVDWFVPHQANKRIIDATARKLGVASERIILTVQNHANTSAASIPLALDTGVRDGRIKEGDIVLIEAIGGGLSWGASVIRW